MTWVDITNLRGPRGQDGKDGEQGPAGPVNIGLIPAEPIVWDQAGGFTFNLIDGSQQTVNLPIASAQSAGLLGAGGQLPSTGPRQINDLIESGARASGDLVLERIGPLVMCSVNEVAINRSSGSARLFTIPAGFRPRLSYVRSSVFWKNSTQIRYLDAFSTGGFWMHHGGAEELHNAQLCWTTANAWPASLPGVSFT